MRRWAWADLGRRPFFFPACAVVAGAAAAPLDQPHRAAWILFPLAASLLGVAGARGQRPFGTLALLAGAFTAGAGLAAVAASCDIPVSWTRGGRVILRGQVDRVVLGSDRLQADLRLERVGGLDARAGARLSGPPSAAPRGLFPGQQVAVEARLRPLTGPSNPGEWSSAELLRRRGTAVTGGFPDTRLAVLSPPSRWQAWRARAHEALLRDASRLAPSQGAGALVMALAAGRRAELGPAVEDSFARSGLVHILSVSGLHVAALALALFAALRSVLVRLPVRRLRAVDARRVAAPLAVPLVWGYVAYTGACPPAVRSAVVCSLVLAGYALRRRSDALNALAAAALAMTVADPATPFELSARLSFLATGALIVLAPALLAPVQRASVGRPRPSPLRRALGEALRRMLQTGAASVAATLACAPLVLQAFGRLSVVGIVSNVAAMPVSGVLTVCAALGAGVHAVAPTASSPLLWVGGWCAEALLWLSDAFSRAPGASLALGAPGLAASVVWWAGLGGFALGFRRLSLAAPAAALAFGVVQAHARWSAEREVAVTFLAVGTGDATVISSGGHHALVDGGGVPSGPDTGERFVLPFLRARHVSSLELAVLSHAHPDHALGLVSALEAVPARRLWLSAAEDDGELRKSVQAAARGALVERVTAGRSPLTLGAATIEVLGPPRPFDALPTENDRSVVLRVRHGDVTFLLSGDVESAAEALIEPGPVTVMKAPHHGSLTSSTERWVEGSRPRYVVFCVGRANRFDFPRREVVERYEGAGARCFRTDRDGAVTFRSNGRDVEVETFLPGA